MIGRWGHFDTSIFTAMTVLANRCGAVNLAQGFPDFEGPEVIKQAAIAALNQGHNQYAPSAGVPVLREALKDFRKRQTGMEYDPAQEITVFSGASEGIFCALQALLNPGDEVIAFEPFFDIYPTGVYAAHGNLKGVKLNPPDWKFSREEFQKAITAKTRVILLNTPHNPLGRVFTESELAFVADIARRHDLLVVTDEVYEELVFAPNKHLSIAALPEMRERTIVISSTAKTYSYTGWKIGYSFASAELTRLLRNVHQFTVFCSATPLQWGMAAISRVPSSYFEEFRLSYRERRDYLKGVLETAGFSCLPPEGSYFITADYGRISSKPDLEFAKWLTEEVGVSCIPLSSFYGDPKTAMSQHRYVRFAFCKELATIQEAAKRLAKIASKV